MSVRLFIFSLLLAALAVKDEDDVVNGLMTVGERTLEAELDSKVGDFLDAVENTPGDAPSPSPCIVLSTDPAEELDDLFAFKYGVLEGGYAGKIHVIISGGGATPDERLEALNTYLASVSTKFKKFNFGNNNNRVYLYRDADNEDYSTLPKNSCDAYVNNGPVTNTALVAIFGALKANKPTAYLVGAKPDGSVGGINQKGSAKEDWEAFIKKLKGNHAKLLVLPPDITRRVRFPNKQELFPTGSHIRDVAARSAMMFAASRPGNKYFVFPGAYELMLRLNEANKFVCEAWLKEMGTDFTISPTAKAKAKKKAQAYIDALPKKDKSKGDDEWNKLRDTAYVPLMVTYQLAQLAQIDEPYAADKFGFKPEEKMNPNPGDAFESASVVTALTTQIMQRFKTLTPTYDVLAIALAIKKETKELDSAPEKIVEYQKMVNGMYGL